MESNVAQLPLSHKAWAWLEKNRTQATYGAAVLVILGIIAGFLVWRAGQKEASASSALSNVAMAQPTAPGQAADTPEAYLAIASQYPHSMAGTRAMLLAAGSYFTSGKFAQAQTEFEKFTREHRNSPFLGEALLGVAASLEAQGKIDQAITAYKDLISRHPGESVVPQAKFALARLYEVKNQFEQARDLYEDVERSSPYTTIGNESGMRLEELAANYPKLARAPNMPAMSPVTIKPSPVLTNPPVRSLATNSPAAPAKK